MVKTMFNQRMQSIMMQDRKRLRHVFEQYDTGRTGRLSTDQFHAALQDLAGNQMDVDRDMAENLLKRFSSEPGYILFSDFVVNFLGLPEDFFSMKLLSDNAAADNAAAARDG